MAPFPEAEDMTIKRLYVALKRSDMQLLQMGAHKLHEKYHTGHKFELLDDLKQILFYVEEQNIPNDIKDLLTRTINNILNGEIPISQNNSTYYENDENQNPSYANETQDDKKDENQTFEQDIYKSELSYNSTYGEPVIFTPKEEKSPIDVIYPRDVKFDETEAAIQDNSIEIQSEENPEILAVQEKNENINEEAQTENGSFNVPEYVQSLPTEEIVQKQEVQFNSVRESHETHEEQTLEFTQKEIKDEIKEVCKEAPVIEPIEECNQSFQSEPVIKTTENNINYPNYQDAIILEEESTLKNVAVFYDDKAVDNSYIQNKIYRAELDNILLSKDANAIENAAINKMLSDTPTDEISEILKMLNTIKGEVYFVTTSKSENILKTFIGNGIDFKIPLVNDSDINHKAVNLIPLLGLSNIFVCQKCGHREYFGGFHNKVLTLQCKSCDSVMYPDIYDVSDYQTNSSPYYWINAMKLMAKADTWILINPPLENNKGLIAEFIKSSFEVVHPKKVYILSKETTRKEYYKQAFKEIYNACSIKSDYITQDDLCEDFINSEISAVKVNV